MIRTSRVIISRLGNYNNSNSGRRATSCSQGDNSYNQDSDIAGQGEKCLTDSGKLGRYSPEWKLSQALPWMEAAMIDDVLVLESVPSVHATLGRQPDRYGCAAFCLQVLTRRQTDRSGARPCLRDQGTSGLALSICKEVFRILFLCRLAESNRCMVRHSQVHSNYATRENSGGN